MTTPTKVCFTCSKEFPATLDHFHKYKQSSSGLHPYCKACANAVRKRYCEKNREQIREKDRQYSLLNREKRSESNRKWRERNKEKVKREGKAYYAQNRQSLNEYRRKYQQENRDVLNKVSREHYRLNHAERLQYAKEYRENHSDSVAGAMKEWAKNNQPRVIHFRRARSQWLRAGEGITSEDIERQYQQQKGRCYWCSNPTNGNFHLDHVIPLSKGGEHSPANAVVSCPHCNLSKGKRLPFSEWQPPNPLRQD